MKSDQSNDYQPRSLSLHAKRPWYKSTVTLGQTLHVALTLAAFGLGWTAARQSEQAREMTLQLWDNYYSYLMVDANREGLSQKTTVDFETPGLQSIGQHLYLRGARIATGQKGHTLSGEIVNSSSIPLEGIELRLFVGSGVHDIRVGTVEPGRGKKFSVDILGVPESELRTAKLISRCADINYAAR